MRCWENNWQIAKGGVMGKTEVYDKYVCIMLTGESLEYKNYFEGQTAFEKAWEIFDYAFMEDAPMEELTDLLNKLISLTPTTEKMLDLWEKDEVENKESLGDAVLTWEKIVTLALDKANSKEDAWLVMISRYCDLGSKEFMAAFDKYLELCKFKEEVEWLMGQICKWLGGCGDLEYEKYFLKIFQRGRELPNKSEESENKDIDDIE